MDELTLRPVARIRSDFPEKFGIPRQSGILPELTSRVVFEPEFRIPEMLRGIEGYDYLWLIWVFSESGRRWSPTVRPPRLGGNARMGVFATRSPFRPNPLGLSSVRLLGVEDSPEGKTLRIAGADLMDGTPILDIKPYLPFTDSHPDAKGGFSDRRSRPTPPSRTNSRPKSGPPSSRSSPRTPALPTRTTPEGSMGWRSPGRKYILRWTAKRQGWLTSSEIRPSDE